MFNKAKEPILITVLRRQPKQTTPHETKEANQQTHAPLTNNEPSITEEEDSGGTLNENQPKPAMTDESPLQNTISSVAEKCSGITDTGTDSAQGDMDEGAECERGMADGESVEEGITEGTQTEVTMLES